MAEAKRMLGRIWRQPALSPAGLLLRAAIIGAAFLLAHAVGLRGYTAIVSGSSPTAQGIGPVGVALGVAYCALYLGVVLAAPVLVIAAALLALADRLFARLTRGRSAHEDPDSPPASR